MIGTGIEMRDDILDALTQQTPAAKTIQAPTDPLTAAMGAQPKPPASFFPAAENPSFTADSSQGKFKFGQNSFTNMLVADDRKDLMRDTDNIFYGGGQAPAPTPTPVQTPHLLAGLHRPFQGPTVLSTDVPNSQASIGELAKPPSQIPLNQFQPSEGDKHMQDWYENLTNRMMARDDVASKNQKSPYGFSF